MAQGGKRPGAGRPKGSKNKSTVARETQALILAHRMAGGGDWKAVGPDPLQILKMTPLEIMDYAMKQAALDGNWELAADLGSKIAPFVHPKVAQIKQDVTIRKRPEDMTDEELADFIGEAMDAETVDDATDEAEAT